MPPIISRIKEAMKKRPPLWKGPEQDGITFSMLSRFLVCRERFRVAFIEGLQPMQGFNHRIEYGSMWHLCEEMFHQGQEWEGALDSYCQTLAMKSRLIPNAPADIEKWKRVCLAQFEVYTSIDGGKWAQMAGPPNGKLLFSEKTFGVPLQLPSGRKVLLRGKWDTVWMAYQKKGDKKTTHSVLQENKTKGDIKPEQLRRQLTNDLQTMIYLIALDEAGYCPRALKYNLIRRPLSGGRHSIQQKKGSKNFAPETTEEYYDRLKGLIAEDPEYFFMRWDVPIEQRDIDRFKQRTLLPILEQLCGWYDWIVSLDKPFDQQEMNGGLHWQHPFGVYNVLDEGGATDYDAYLTDGNPTGLERVDKLFPELGDV